MFGFIDKIVTNPIGTAIDAVTSPAVDACDVLQGLTEGELREKAALRLGADIAAGMALGELIEALEE
jgi:hypothetical protein